MDTINHLQALRQELSDKLNTLTYGDKRGRATDKAITAIDNLIIALEELNNAE